MFKSSISIVVLHLLLLVSFGGAYTLPPVVQMGGAIVAAVEQDAEQEAAAEERQRVERHWLSMAETQLHSLITDDLSTEEVNNMLETWSTEGRGKHKKQKKLMKMVYPLLAAVAVAKVVLLPLILKWLTALSTSSFVMGKIALVTSGILALKWILSGGHAHDRLEIIHSHAPLVKGLHASDLSSSGSSWMPIRQPFIPLVSKDPNLYKPFL
uniref:Osiris 13 n=1 Tax=Drosophila melanogaster TaxID=7227 RepID=Q9VNN5_DROME|eukprot:NP_649634.1 osiris 13 [Drosophila melanogaster]